MSPWVRESSYSISLHDTQVRERAPSRAHHQAGAPQHRQEALAARSPAGGGGRPPRRRAPRVTRGSPGRGRGRVCAGGRRPTGGAAAGGEGGAGAGAHCRCPSGPGRDARLPATPAMTITEPTTRMSISNPCYNDSPLFWPPCHMLGKCGRDYCPYFTDKETEARPPGEIKVGCGRGSPGARAPGAGRLRGSRTEPRERTAGGKPRSWGLGGSLDAGGRLQEEPGGREEGDAVAEPLPGPRGLHAGWRVPGTFRLASSALRCSTRRSPR